MKQPSTTSERKLDDVLENGVDEVIIRNRHFKISWLKKGTLRRLSHVMLSCKNEDELSARCASLILLNGYWKIFLFHRILWRFLWRKYSDEELMPLIILAKKKVELSQQAYLTNTILLTGMKDTMMTMTRKEAEHFRQELKQQAVSQSEKSTEN